MKLRRFTVNKKAITARMSKDAGITGIQAEKAFTSLIGGIRTSLKKGKRVTFSGFGSFDVKTRKARNGRNPKTGEPIHIPQKKRVKFNPSKGFIDSL
jgi:DNA-binding protein HU-beta